MAVAQRGSAVTKGFGVAYPMAVPAGTATDDVFVWLIINYAGGVRSHADFTTIVNQTYDTATIQVLVSKVGTPPANLTPVGANANDESILVAFSGVDFAALVSAVTLVQDIDGDTDLDLPSITAPAPGELLLVGNRNVVFSAGGTLLGSNSDLRISRKTVAAGATGLIPVVVVSFGFLIGTTIVLPEFVAVPSVGYRLTMAGDKVLTMAGDRVLLMGGAPVGVTGGIKFNGVVKPIKFGAGWPTKKLKRHNGTTWVETS